MKPKIIRGIVFKVVSKIDQVYFSSWLMLPIVELKISVPLRNWGNEEKIKVKCNELNS